ncbi:MAG TPA: OST-HTH/LOTUS domain-containing protein, partial [Ramlibacter sp.]
LVSSDCDFTPLVMHLRAKGATVFGFGELKTPKPFVNACSRFLYVDKAQAAADEVEPRAATSLRVEPSDLKQDTALISMLRNTIKAAADEEGWARVGEVGHLIRNQSSQQPRNYGYATWTKLLKVVDLFELRDEGKPSVMVRDRRNKQRG